MSTVAIDPGITRPALSPLSRLEMLLDEGSLRQWNPAAGSTVGVARGRIAGNEVVAYCTDARTMGGAIGAPEATRIIEAIELALQLDCPVIGLWHSGGAKLADGVESMDGVGRMFAAMTRASGRVPQISVVLGPAAGAAAYGPALTDVVIMSDAGRMFVTGPDVVRRVTGEVIDLVSLGGPDTHGRRSGVVHVAVSSEMEAYASARRLTDLYARRAEFVADGERPTDPATLLPASSRRAYDVRPLIQSLLDTSPAFEELQARWAPNMVTGIGRLGGGTIGVLANNPLRKGGCLESLSSEKAARFVRMCDAFGIPLLSIVDVPGYLPGVGQEWGGVIRRGAKLLHAFAECVVPRVTLLTRKAYGGAYIAMNSRSLGATTVLAWSSAEVAVMGAEAAVDVLYRKQLAAATEDDRLALRARFMDEYHTASGGMARAVRMGVVDAVIQPVDTRRRLIDTFASVPPKRGSHGNIPL
jgi:acetyl-CoA/propionyl-CoA carboxylase carboxyl transferase subunit